MALIHRDLLEPKVKVIYVDVRMKGRRLLIVLRSSTHHDWHQLLPAKQGEQIVSYRLYNLFMLSNASNTNCYPPHLIYVLKACLVKLPKRSNTDFTGSII